MLRPAWARAGQGRYPVESPAPVFSESRLPDAAAQTDGLDVTVVLPAFNEVGHIRQEVERISACLKETTRTFEVLVIDDGSSDGTADAVDGMPFVRLLRFPVNRGSGTARRIGTLQARGRYVVWTDADMTYPNERIGEFVDYLERTGSDQVVGARTSEEGTLKALRVPAKWAIRRLAEFLSDSKIPDLNSGLRAFRKEVARPYLGLLPPGFSCVTTITLAFLANGHRVDYLPIRYRERAGRSHFHPIKDAYRYILQVVRMVTFFEPLRVFGPVALTLLFVGTGKFVYDQFQEPFRIAANTLLLLLGGLIIFAVGLLADLIVRTNRHG